LVCWAHQINLVVSDFLGLRVYFLEAMGQALDVVKWFNNHGGALDLLQKEQRFTYEGKCFALLLPVVTRWTAYYLSITQLLKVWGAVVHCSSWSREALLVCAGPKADAKEKVESILSIHRSGVLDKPHQISSMLLEENHILTVVI